jgi:phosphoglycolate phosphatase
VKNASDLACAICRSASLSLFCIFHLHFELCIRAIHQASPEATDLEFRLRVCLFDIDGTLVSTGGAGKAAMDVALLEEFGVRKPIVPGSMSGRTDRGIAREQFALHGIDDSPENWRRLIAAYLRHLPRHLQERPGSVLPGILEVLTILSRAEVSLGLLTGNVPDGARIKLTHYRLMDYFAFGSYGDRHLTRDEIAHEALRLSRAHWRADCCGDDLLVIGDTPLDVQCARAIGAPVVAVATGVHSCAELAATRPDVLLSDLSDPRPLLALAGLPC